MPRFGAYESVTELFRGPLGAVWTARRGGSGPAEFVVKTCTPDVDITGAEQGAALIELLRDSAEVQKAAAGAGGAGAGGGGGSHWAPVHDIGAIEPDPEAGTPGGAYWVSDYYPRSSLQRWIEARLPVDARGLAAVLRAVIAGLRELQRACGRAHGYLKASNVLLAGEGDLTQSRVLLTDPLPAKRLPAKGADRIDLRGLGELLHHLVMRQAYREMGAWPLPDSAEWGKLKGGAKWRELCNRLLAPEGSGTEGFASLEEVEQAIEGALEAGKRPKWFVPAIAGGGVAAVALIVAVVVFAGGSKQVAPEQRTAAQSNFQRLCVQFVDWVRQFSEGMGKPAPPAAGSRRGDLTRRAWYEQNAELGALVGSLLWPTDSKAPPADPRKIANQKGGDVEGWASGQTRLPSAATSVEGAAATVAALERTQAFVDGLVAWAQSAGLGEAARLLRERGLEVEAGLVEGLIESLKIKPDGKPDVASRIDAALLALPVAEAIARAWGEFTGSGEALAGTEDAVLREFKVWASEEASRPPPRLESGGGSGGSGVAPLEGRLRVVEEVRRLGGQLTAFVQANWDETSRELLTQEEPVYQRLAGGGKADRAAFEEWLRAAPGYVRLQTPDPREETEVLALLEEVPLLRRQLEEGGETITDSLRQAFSGAESARSEWDALKSVPWIEKRRTQVEQGVAGLRTRMEGFRRTLYAASEALRERGRRWTEEVRAKVSLGGSAAIDRAWIQGRDELLKSHEATPLLAKPRVEEWGRALEELNKAMGGSVATDTRPTGWRGELQKLKSDEREHLLGERLKGLAPLVDADGVVELAKRLPGEYSTWLASVVRLEAEAVKLEAMLDGAYGLKEEGPEGTVEELERRCREAETGLAEAVVAVIAPVRGRVEELRKLGAVREPGALVKAGVESAEGRPELIVAAWRALGGEVSRPWPATLADLDEEMKVWGRVTALAGAMRGDAAREARRRKLEEELGAGAVARWQRCFAGLREATEIEAAAALLDRFGVSPEQAARMPGRLRYNIELARLRAAVKDDDAPEAEVRSDLGKFIADVKALGEAARDPKVAALLEELGKVERDEDKPKAPDPWTLGPGSQQIGWIGKLREDGVLQFTPPGEDPEKAMVRLMFLRCTSAEGGSEAAEGAFYLGTTEVSLRQFVNIVRSRGRWEDVEALQLELFNDNGALQHPRVWAPSTDRTRLILAKDWRVPIGVASQIYPGKLRDPTDPSGNTMIATLRPTWDHPMQRVSLPVAAYAARLVGCRLPSSSEWEAARKQHEAAVPNDASINLRDATWADYLQHTDTRKRQANAREYPWPNADIFEPDPDPSRKPEEEEPDPAAPPDGVLWFARVSEGAKPGDSARFWHLRGNVSEYVVDAESMEKIPATPEGVREYLEKNFNSLGVIGGSALSPARIRWTERAPLPGGAAGVAELVGHGYADVGFRLAFGAKGSEERRRTLAERVRDKVSTATYLLEN